MNSKFNSQELSQKSGSERDHHEGEDKLSKNNDEIPE